MIAARTPEGVPNRCPVCGHPSEMEPLLDTRDATCPDCGSLLSYEAPLYCRHLTSEMAGELLALASIQAWARYSGKPVPEMVVAKLEHYYAITEVR